MNSSGGNKERRRSRAGTSAGRGSGRGSTSESDAPPRGRGAGNRRAQTPSSPRGGDRGHRPGTYYRRGQPSGRVFQFGSVPAPPVQPVTDIDDGPIADDPEDAHVELPQVPPPIELQSSSLPLRPGFGTDGREIELRTNFFPVHPPQGRLYEYHVAISPAIYQRPMKRRIFRLAEQTTAWSQAGLRGKVAYDFSERLISAIQLPQPLTIAVPYYAERESGPPAQGGEVYTLSIDFVREIDMRNLESCLSGEPSHRDHNIFPVITALNIILTSISRKTDLEVGRNQYVSPVMAEPFRLDGILEAWKRFYSTTKPLYRGLVVRVSFCTTAFYAPGNLARATLEFRNSTFRFRATHSIRVKTTHLGNRETVRFNLVGSDTASARSFDTPEYGRVTVEDYFRQKHDVRLRYPNLPLVSTGIGQTLTYLPAEVCEILPGQRFRRMFTHGHAASLIAVAHQSPDANAVAIVHQVRSQLGLDVTRPELRSFGITISTDMAVVPGRILPKPGIQYSSRLALIDDQKASWNPRGVNLKFAVGARLDKWAVLVIKDNPYTEGFTGPEDVRRAVASFRNTCNVNGMHISEDPAYVVAQLPRKNSSDPFRRAAIATIRDALLRVKPKPIMFLVVLANADQAVYDNVKHLCDVSLDVATVCVQSPKFCKGNSHYLANVALKVNMKLGGINHKLSPESKEWLNSTPTMIVGIKVSPGQAAGTPSIAAVVASVDSDFAQYPAGLEIQEGKEMVTDLKSMMADRLKLFQRRNDGKLPERIIIYRGGISEGQIRSVREIELPLLLDACRVFSGPIAPYRPMLSIITYSKHNHVRFYPATNNRAGSSRNPPPGTVVDRGITVIYGFDFFLQSHGVQQGTARPIRYHVIHDEINFTANEVQGLTHSLSYMSARTTRAVKLACPAYHAELASQHGWCYLRGLSHGFLGEGSSEDSAEVDGMEEARRLWSGGVSRAGLKDTMFYL